MGEERSVMTHITGRTPDRQKVSLQTESDALPVNEVCFPRFKAGALFALIVGSVER